MRLLADYLQLRKAFPHIAENEAFAVTMAELAEIFFCTQRNAKLIVQKMIEQQWVAFVPGRGRGHVSTLSFLSGKEDVLLQAAEALVELGEVEAAFRLLKEQGESIVTKERFVAMLSRYFGYRVEAGDDSPKEMLRLPLYRTINTLDPREVFFAFDAHLIKQIFATLVEINEETGEPMPNVAHHWRRNEAATVWTFYLRKGVQFHHGREVTAQDVQYSISRLQLPESPQQWLVKEIEKMEVLSRYVIRFTLRRPNHLFLLFLSFPPASIVPQDRYEQMPQEHELPVGCGPFRVIEWTKGRCVLEAFDNYFLGRPYLDQVEIIVVPQIDAEYRVKADSNLLLVKTGEEDKEELQEWKKGREMSGCNMLSINLRKAGPLQDIRLRKAMFHLINREQMVADLQGPRIYPAGNLRYPPLFQTRDANWQETQAALDLQASGYRGETLHLYTFARHEADAYWLKRLYEAYGILLEVHIVSWNEFLQRETTGKADLLLFEAVLSEGIIRLIEYFQSANSPIYPLLPDSLAAFVDEQISQLLADASTDGREEKLAMIEQRINAEYALIYLTYKSVQTAFHPSMQGVKVNQRAWVDFKDVWFDRENAFPIC